ncbi:MAG: sigma-54 dependent transcriptional regulator [Kofleriaceae bacterium]
MSKPQRVVIADDNPALRRGLARTFAAAGFDPVEAADGAAAVAAVQAQPPAAVLLDVQMPGLGGIEALRVIRQATPSVPVLMLTGHGEIPLAVEAIRAGATDFLTRPIDGDQLVATVRRAISRSVVLGANDAPGPSPTEPPLRELMGPSAAIEQLAHHVDTVANTGLTVLILGETGAGKELVARAVHGHSARATRPFVAIDCGAIPENLLESEMFGYERGAFSGADRRKEGWFELAGDGTLFLDEIGNLSTLTQAKLLRVLQERCVQHLGGGLPVPIHCRVIAATNEDILARVAADRFRADLYYRLSEYVLHLPPLRDRPGDVASLARRFVAEASVSFGRTPPAISAEALAALAGYRWPGNVRELRNVARQALLRCAGELIGLDELDGLLRSPIAPARPEPDDDGGFLARGSGVLLPSKDGRAPGAPGESLREIAGRAVGRAERVAIADALRRARGNKSLAARLLQIDFKTLTAKMRRFELDHDDVDEDVLADA